MRSPGAAWNARLSRRRRAQVHGRERRGEHGLRSVAVGVEGEHQPGVRVGPQVDVVDAGARVARLEPEADRVVTCDTACGQPGDVVRVGVGQRAMGQRGRQQVGVAWQPDRRVDARLGLFALVVPTDHRRAVSEEIDLAGRQELVHPPVLRVAPPHLHPRVTAEQVGDVAEVVGHRQPQSSVDLHLAGVRRGVAALHPASRSPALIASSCTGRARTVIGTSTTRATASATRLQR